MFNPLTTEFHCGGYSKATNSGCNFVCNLTVETNNYGCDSIVCIEGIIIIEGILSMGIN